LLQQSEFLTNYVGSFQELRTAEELLDVTIACEDQTMEAHKVVLSACSPFFRGVFKKSKEKHPFVYLKGVLHRDLVSLMDYIYTGETQVQADDVDRFIEVAREMKVKGLAEEDEEVENSDRSDEASPDEVLDTTDNLTIETEVSKLDLLEDTAELENSVSTLELKQEKQNESKDKEQLILEISERIERVTDEAGESMWKCTECGKMLKKKNKLQMHVEIHLEGFSHACVHCEKVHKTRGALSAHMSIVHKGNK